MPKYARQFVQILDQVTAADIISSWSDSKVTQTPRILIDPDRNHWGWKSESPQQIKGQGKTLPPLHARNKITTVLGKGYNGIEHCVGLTSGAIYSTVPQNENAFLSSPNIESLIRPKSVNLMWPSWSRRMLQVETKVHQQHGSRGEHGGMHKIRQNCPGRPLNHTYRQMMEKTIELVDRHFEYISGMPGHDWLWHVQAPLDQILIPSIDI